MFTFRAKTKVTVALIISSVGASLSIQCSAMTWSFPGASNAPTSVAQAAELSATQFLVVGGSAESRLLDTQTLVWSTRVNISATRSGFALTSFATGQLLVTGGYLSAVVTNASERYDATLDSWTPAAPMLSARRGHLAVRMAAGNVLVIGGFDSTGAAIQSVELSDATVSAWTSRAATPWTVSSTTGRVFALGDGKAVVVHSAGVGVWDPTANVWTDAPLPAAATGLALNQLPMALLGDGRLVLASVGVYNVATNTWADMAASPRAFSTAAAIAGNRAIFSGGELVPCNPSLFCQSNFAYEYSPATNQWTDLGNQTGTMAPAITLTDGGYFAGVNNAPANGYSFAGALYRRSVMYQMYIENQFDLPITPVAGQSYAVNVGYSGQSDILARTRTGTFTVSDGSATCQAILPATSCTITTSISGQKTLMIDYSGDENFAPYSITYAPHPHVIVERNLPAYVYSAPSGIYDIGFLYSTFAAFAAGTTVTLTANPNAGNTFIGWLGDCVGTAPCTFTMPADRHVRAKAFAAPNTYAPFNVDVDRDGAATAATDGLVILRYLLNYPASTVGSGAMSANAAPPGGSAINYLASIRPRLDVDGNGQADALTDGLLIIRYLAGFRGDALIANCIGVNARRSTAVDIEAYLATLLP